MGSKTSGNRTQRTSKRNELKSSLFQFRLHPDNPDERWAMDMIDFYARQGKGLRQVFVECMGASHDHAIEDAPIIAHKHDVADIRDMVKWLYEQAVAGNLGGGRGKKSKEKAFEAPAHLQDMLNHYLDGGISDDDE